MPKSMDLTKQASRPAFSNPAQNILSVILYNGRNSVRLRHSSVDMIGNFTSCKVSAKKQKENYSTTKKLIDFSHISYLVSSRTFTLFGWRFSTRHYNFTTTFSNQRVVHEEKKKRCKHRNKTNKQTDFRF